MSGILRAIGLDAWFDVTPTVIAVASMYGTYYLLNRYHEENEWSAPSTLVPTPINLLTQNACATLSYNYNIQATDLGGNGAAQEALAKATGAQYISLGCPDPSGNILTYTKNNCGQYPDVCPSQLFADPTCAGTLAWIDKLPSMKATVCSAMATCLENLDTTKVQTDDDNGNVVCMSACQVNCGSTFGNGCCGVAAAAAGGAISSPCIKGGTRDFSQCVKLPYTPCNPSTQWSANSDCGVGNGCAQ